MFFWPVEDEVEGFLLPWLKLYMIYVEFFYTFLLSPSWDSGHKLFGFRLPNSSCRTYLDLFGIDQASFLQLCFQPGSPEISANPIAGAGVQSFVHGIDRFSSAGEVQTYCRDLQGTFGH